MKLGENIYETIFVQGGREHGAIVVLLDKENAKMVADQMLSVSAGEAAMYVFRDVKDELYGLAADKIDAINMKVYVDAEDIATNSQGSSSAGANPDANKQPQGQGTKPAKVARRPRIIGLDQSN
jgi:hypothetical protein